MPTQCVKCGTEVVRSFFNQRRLHIYIDAEIQLRFVEGHDETPEGRMRGRAIR
jgi:hypothetical protein